MLTKSQCIRKSDYTAAVEYTSVIKMKQKLLYCYMLPVSGE